MIIAIIISLFVGAFFGFAIAALLNISKGRQIDSEEYSLGQEDKIVVVEDIIPDSEDQEENEE